MDRLDELKRGPKVRNPDTETSEGSTVSELLITRKNQSIDQMKQSRQRSRQNSRVDSLRKYSFAQKQDQEKTSTYF